MAKYVKLGSKAHSFSDPTTGVKLVPGEVTKLTATQEISKRIIMAIKGGHLEKVNKDEYERYLSGNTDIDEQDDDAITVDSLNKETKEQLVKRIVELSDEHDESDLKKKNKNQLIDIVMELMEEEEEEDED